MNATPHEQELPQALVDDVTERLRAVCADLPPADFEALVRDVVRIKVKYGSAAPPRRPPAA